MPLVWGDSLAAHARECAASNDKIKGPPHLPHTAPGCVPPHGPGHWGQNLAKGYGTAARGVQGWYDEIKETPGGKGDATHFTGGIGHYTQVVWKGTRKVGCATVGASFCCNYLPAGNMTGILEPSAGPELSSGYGSPMPWRRGLRI